MLIYSGGILKTSTAMALGVDCCCDATCCPSTIPLTPGTVIGQTLVVVCIDPITEETCTCTWTWDGSAWVLTGDSCS
jgi:hypothetical protein